MRSHVRSGCDPDRTEEPQKKKLDTLLTVVGPRAVEDLCSVCADMETNFSVTQYGQALFQFLC